MDTSTVYLPPIPIDGRNTTAFPSPDQNESQEHYERMQNLLLDSVDRQMTEMYKTIKNKDIDVKVLRQEKESIGVTLYNAKSEITRLQDKINSMKKIVDKAEERANETHIENRLIYKQLLEVSGKHQEAETELEKSKHSHDKTKEQYTQLGDVAATYALDLKIKHRITSKVSKELEILQEEKKEAHHALEAQKKKTTGILQGRIELESLLKVQRSETIIAQKAIDKMSHEFAHLRDSNGLLQKQLEESITAMAKRDQTFHLVQGQKEKCELDLVAMKQYYESIKSDHQDLLKNFQTKETECGALKDRIVKLSVVLQEREKTITEKETALSVAEAGEFKDVDALKRLNNQKEVLSQQLHHKNESISELRAQIDSLKTDFETRLQRELDFKVALTVKEVSEQNKKAADGINRLNTDFTLSLRQTNANLQLQNDLMSKELFQSNAERNLYKDNYEAVNTHYLKLYDQSHKIIHQHERLQHDLIAASDKIAEYKLREKNWVTDDSLQLQLNDTRIELQKMQSMWIDSQKEVCDLKEKALLTEKNAEFLRTKLVITGAREARSSDAIEQLQAKSVEEEKESSKLTMLLEKAEKQIKSLQKENLDIREHLVDLEAKLSETMINSSTSENMLKGEIKRLYKDSNAEKKIRKHENSVGNVLEQKFELSREIVHKLKADRTELQRENFKLKSALADTEKRFASMKVLASRMEEQSQRSFEKTLEVFKDAPCLNRSATGKRPDWASFLPTPEFNGGSGSYAHHAQSISSIGMLATTSMSEKSNLPPLPHVSTAADPYTINKLPDFESWKLKIQSLSQEVSFLRTENSVLQKKVGEMNKKFSLNERKLKNSLTLSSSLEKETWKHHERIAELEAREKRAVNIASYMEYQLREKIPNIKINYNSVRHIQPTTQLASALESIDVNPLDLPKPASLAVPQVNILSSSDSLDIIREERREGNTHS